MSDRIETFHALETAGICRHAFINRIPGIDVNAPREEALQRLDQSHTQIRLSLGFGPLALAEQVHGNKIAIVEDSDGAPIKGVDGLIVDRPGICLGIYVADCCAVYLIDPKSRCIALVHAGKKGTELGIVPEAISILRARFGANPERMIAQLSPCIRPPFYEINFAAETVRQCRANGIDQVFDCGANTGADLTRYYSYRIERGKTGRMLALFEII